MFKLGEYDRDEAEDVASYLRAAGIRVELRPYLSVNTRGTAYLEGRLSEIREEMEDFEIEEYEQYLDALRTVLAAGTSSEEFRDQFWSVLDPAWMDKKDQVKEIVEGWADPSSEGGYDEEKIEEDAEEYCEEDAEADDDDDDDELVTEQIELVDDVFNNLLAVLFAENVIQLNELDLDEARQLDDDPLISILVDPDEYELDHPLIKTKLSFELYRCFDVYIDEIDAPLIDDIDDEFVDDYSEEHMTIVALGMLVANLFEPPSGSRKVDLDEFKDMCVTKSDMDDVVMEIDGYSVAEQIAKGLEKRGIVKIKGDKIKWKKSGRA